MIPINLTEVRSNNTLINYHFKSQGHRVGIILEAANQIFKEGGKMPEN